MYKSERFPPFIVHTTVYSFRLFYIFRLLYHIVASLYARAHYHGNFSTKKRWQAWAARYSKSVSKKKYASSLQMSEIPMQFLLDTSVQLNSLSYVLYVSHIARWCKNARRQIARQNDEVVQEHLVLLPTVPSEGKRGHAFVIHHRISRERFNGHAQIARNSLFHEH